MSRVVFFGIPAHGHTNPTLGVVRELVARGHQVWYYSYDMMRERIEAAGATFISCDAYDVEKKLSPKEVARIGKDMAFSTEILVDTTLALDEAVCAAMEELRPDCIVADSMALWGRAVAKKLGIPLVSSTTTFAFNKHSAKIMKQGLGDILRMIFSAPKIAKQVERLKVRGYPVNSILDIIGNDDDTHTIVYASPAFQPCSETFSEKYAFVGPCIRESVSEIEKKREKLLYISMGTVNNDMLPFYKSCISAFADTAYQVIMSVGEVVPTEFFGALPENIEVFPHVDQIAVLKKADVFVSHCGMNSASESLYFGVPLIVLPQTSEQKGVATRILQLGAGIKPDKADGANVLRAAERISKEKSFSENAEKLAREFARTLGAKGAANKIEEVCNN